MNEIVRVGRDFRVTIPRELRAKAAIFEGDFARIDIKKIIMAVEK